jgi:PKD repeat protein
MATIGLGNQAPIADVNNPYKGIANEPVAFDGTGSSDPDGTIVAYDWDFGDGNTGSGESPTHTYTEDGTYNVTLTVTDDMGATDSAGTTVTIEPGNQMPIANVNNPYKGIVNVPVKFDGSGSSDPDGNIVAYDWNFGDGSSGSGAMPTHTYTVDGTYQVTLTVTDDMGAIDSVTTSATIVPDDGDTDPPSGDIQERLKAVRKDLMAVAKDREYSRKVRWMFSHGAKRLSKAAIFHEKGKIKNASKEVEKAIKKIKKAAKLGKRNHELKDRCEEFIRDMKKLKTAIKEHGTVISPDDDHDHDDDDDHRDHDNDSDDDDD